MNFMMSKELLTFACFFIWIKSKPFLASTKIGTVCINTFLLTAMVLKSTIVWS